MTIQDPRQSLRCYLFKKGYSEGRTNMKQLLGGKGANLCEMAHLNLNVPPGMTITTEMCEEFQKSGGKLPEGLWDDVLSMLKQVEKAHGHTFASSTELPLLLSVRSGAAVSMPGMMDTVLNLGLNDIVVETLAKYTDDRFAYDCYRRLLDMYANVVLGVDHDEFETALSAVRKARGVQFDVELTGDDLKDVVQRYKAIYKTHGLQLPKDPYEQLQASIAAVFRSWNTPRAVKYREINKITGLKGTAVNIQAMVYGNFNSNSGTGVCFTRNPANGQNDLFGEFLVNAQGEDVVAGIRTPLPIKNMRDEFGPIYDELKANTSLLETHLQDMQDCEFTVQDGVLFMLQTRNGKRTGHAALKVALDLQKEGVVSKERAVHMVEPRHLEQLLHPQFRDPKGVKSKKVASGLAASPGAAVGRVVFSAQDAEDWCVRGDKVILVRTETSPEDVGGMHAAQGILTARGGMTSHAAVVARGWGKPCVCGCSAISIDLEKKAATIADTGIQVQEGDWISLDGTEGIIALGQQELTDASASDGLQEFMSWVDERRRLKVLANADSPDDARAALAGGAQGIGLVRTEHMFFGSSQRIAAVRDMIAEVELGSKRSKGDGPGLQNALSAIQEFQTHDFQGIFEVMDGRPVTVRLLDPPLHEFLPKPGTPALGALIERVAKELRVEPQLVRAKLDGLREENPMMGFRGCRLGIVHPQITAMQVRAIIQGALNAKRAGHAVDPQIMIPLVGSVHELRNQLDVIHAAARQVLEVNGETLQYKVGTMIETPRACLVADELAPRCDFFSFGTNDLTQLTLGFSRDDAEAHFIGYYRQHGVLAFDPFERVDEEGVGAMVRMAAEKSKTNEHLCLGVCGEHGGDPASIEFFNRVPNMQYVSCSPLRVPLARLGAAQAELTRLGK